MFYSLDLLSLRKRKGKLARIWLAATLNEHLFKQTISLQNIRTITIDTTCEEIMKIVDSRDQNPSGRFSLYLSSQLLYGVTRVFQQQVILFIKDLESTKKELLQFKIQELMRFRSNDALKLLELPDVPTPTFPPLREDVHLLPEAQEPDLITLRCVVEDFDADLNFGALTEQEMQEFYGLHSTELLEDTFARKHLSDQGNIEIPLETSHLFPGIADTLHSADNMLTPTKRECAKQSGTPSKRRRLMYEEDIVTKEAHTTKIDDIITPMEVDLIPKDTLSVHTTTVANISDLPQPEISADASIHLPEERGHPSTSLQLEPLETDEPFYDTYRKKGHKGLLIDVRTKLKGSVYASWTSDVYIATKPLKEANLWHATPAELLKRPSTIIQHVTRKTSCKEYWHDLYKIIITERLQRIMDGEFQETRVMEVPRAQDTISLEQETTDKSKDLITEHSKKEMTADITNPLKVTGRSLVLKHDHHTVEFGDLQDIEIPPDSIDINLIDASLGAKTGDEKNKEAATASAMDFGMPEEEEKVLRNKKKHELSKEGKGFTSSISGSSSTIANGNAQWSRQDLLAILEVHWKDTNLINFCDVIQPETNVQEDAVICFEFILEFVRDGKVVLHQEDINSPLYIQKKK